jgi:ATP-binding cassette subfamily F protein uup
VVKEIAEVVKLGNGDTISAAAFLNYFMFPYPSHFQPVYKLSGGEKRRLYLVTVLMRSPNFLILDEPTNDLDILTLNVLEEYLASFNGCVVVVTHDRYFLDKIVDHLFVFEGDAIIRDFPGNYTQFKIWGDDRKKRTLIQKRVGSRKADSEKQVLSVSNKISFKEKRELEMLEKAIEILEAEKSGIETELQSGKLDPEAMMKQSERWAAIIPEIEARTDRWLELSDRDA